MIHTLFIVNAAGNVIFDRHYQGTINRTICDHFWKEKTDTENAGRLPPVLHKGKVFIFHIERRKLTYLATTLEDAPPLLVLEFLHRMVDVFEEYFNIVTEETLKDNFTTLYQLLDEMMDGGFPCTTETNILKDMIMLPNMLNKTVSAITGQSQVSENISGSMNGIPWRKSNIKYSHNEVFFDIVEEIDAIFDVGGMVASNEINGEILCNCRLSGMPDLLMTFADPTLLDDCSFHPCVRYNRFQAEKVLSFIPPDGQFKLMSFKIARPNANLPVFVKPNLSFSSNSGHVQISVGCKDVGSPKLPEDVIVTFTLPKTTSSHNLSVTMGHLHYDESTKTVRWDIGRMPKSGQPTMSGNVTLVPIQGYHPGNPDIMVEFKVLTFSTSGLKVLSVAVTNERYKPYKGVRSITKAGKIQYRT
eukprot:TRINITY_DN6010_c0_g1_i11.p1 TRINITY_DN6010_c0_g1~~TRINITY_DN6010_c0_g1_i11.p1  ORF type:complete len:416 (-),score=98.71 TRINITY_DN6010_c0_g1_i11:297-1544(-)